MSSGDKPAQKKTILYRMVYDELKHKILERVYADGEKLPFERELCEEYKVDRITVRRALDLLVADNLLEKRAGLGSFVKSPILGMHMQPSKSRNILFVMSENENDINNNPLAFNSQLFHAIEQECRVNGYSIFYAVLDGQSSMQSLINGNDFAGVLFVSYIPKHLLEQCVQMKLPAVCLNNRCDSLISIVPEDERGAYEAVKFLQEKGHRKIAIMMGAREYYSTKERFRGYCAAMFDMALNIDPRYSLEGDWTFDCARKSIFKMLDTVPEADYPTAIFCCSDMMAIGTIDALKERGVSVPREISVMGFDNIQQSEYVYPRLSTVSIDVKLMAELAVDKIINHSQEAPPRGYLLLIPALLEIRQSVGEINQ